MKIQINISMDANMSSNYSEEMEIDDEEWGNMTENERAERVNTFVLTSDKWIALNCRELNETK